MNVKNNFYCRTRFRLALTSQSCLESYKRLVSKFVGLVLAGEATVSVSSCSRASTSCAHPCNIGT